MLDLYLLRLDMQVVDQFLYIGLQLNLLQHIFLTKYQVCVYFLEEFFLKNLFLFFSHIQNFHLRVSVPLWLTFLFLYR